MITSQSATFTHSDQAPEFIPTDTNNAPVHAGMKDNGFRTSLQSTSFNGPEIISTNFNNAHPGMDDVDSSDVILSQPVSVTTYDSQPEMQNVEEYLGSSTINTKNEEVMEIKTENKSSGCREVLYSYCFSIGICCRSSSDGTVASTSHVQNNVYDDYDNDDDDIFCCASFCCCQHYSSPESFCNCECNNCDCDNCDCDCDCDCGDCDCDC